MTKNKKILNFFRIGLLFAFACALNCNALILRNGTGKEINFNWWNNEQHSDTILLEDNQSVEVSNEAQGFSISIECTKNKKNKYMSKKSFLFTIADLKFAKSETCTVFLRYEIKGRIMIPYIEIVGKSSQVKQY